MFTLPLFTHTVVRPKWSVHQLYTITTTVASIASFTNSSATETKPNHMTKLQRISIVVSDLYFCCSSLTPRALSTSDDHTVYEELGSKLRLTRALSTCDDHMVYKELGSNLRLTRVLSTCDDHTMYEELGSKSRLPRALSTCAIHVT